MASLVTLNGLQFAAGTTGTGGTALSNTLKGLIYRAPALSVMDYPGVVGDGVNDDTAGIQNALDDAGGKTVIFPAGFTFLVSDSPQITQNDTTIEAWGATIKACNNFADTATLIDTDMVAPKDFYPIFGFSQAGAAITGCKIFGMTIDGNGANQRDFFSYAGFCTLNSVGTQAIGVTAINVAQNLNIQNFGFSNLRWTESTKTIDDPGLGNLFTLAAIGHRVLLSSGTNVNTTTKFVVTARTNNSITFAVSIKTPGNEGDLANGVGGTNCPARSFCWYSYGNATTGKPDTNTCVSNSHFNNAAYDCVRTQGATCTNPRFIGCYMGTGKQTSFQAYRALGTTISGCVIDNSASAGGAGGGVFLHAAKRTRIVGSRLKATVGTTYAAFGDAVLADNYADDNVIDCCELENDSPTSGIGCCDFNGASAGYDKHRRGIISNSVLRCTNATGNHTCVTYGTDTTGGGLALVNCDLTSVSNEACINYGAARNMIVKNCRVRNEYTGGFAAGRAIVYSTSNAGTPMGSIIEGNHFSVLDTDVDVGKFEGLIDVRVQNNVFAHESASAITEAALIINDCENSDFCDNLILSSAGVAPNMPTHPGGVIQLRSTTNNGCRVMRNRVRRGIGNATNPTYGIGCAGGERIIIAENELSQCGTEAWGSLTLGRGSRMYGNVINVNTSAADEMASGMNNFNSGTIAHAIIPNGATTITVTHNIVSVTGRALRPSDICLTLTNDTTNAVGTLRVENVGPTTFDVKCDNDPGASTAIVAWSAGLGKAA